MFVSQLWHCRRNGVNIRLILGNLYSLLNRTSFSFCVRNAQKSLLAERCNQQAVLGEYIAPTEAPTVRQQRAVLAQQQPAVGAEGSMEPDGVRGDGRCERRAVA